MTRTNAIRTQAQLIEAAKAAGLTVAVHGAGHTTIVRNKNRILRVWADKVMHDANVRSDLARRLNIKDAAELLQLA